MIQPLESRTLMAVTGTPIEIDGVQPVSMDQPQINMLLRRSPTGDPLSFDTGFGETFNVDGYFDTGASGILLAKEVADWWGVNLETYNGEQVQFLDVGVAGADVFNVSEPLYVSVAPFGNSSELDEPDLFDEVYTQTLGPIRMQVSPNESDELLGLLDVVGMPAMRGKVVVMDPRPLESDDPLEGGYMKTYVYNPSTPFNAADDEEDPGIPATELHVDLSYASLDRFTDVTPEGAPGPTLRHNPFIGPNPVVALDPGLPPDNTPGITVSEGSHSFTGSFLLDTGAVTTMISKAHALSLGVHYDPATEDGDDPRLLDANNNPVPNQFTLPIGGIGGSFTAAGFFVDSLTVPTMEGTPIVYRNAPVLVADIATVDPDTDQELTLDGIFGMNNLVASASIEGGFPENITGGAFDWITFDEPNGVLGLSLGDNSTPQGVVGRHVFYNHSGYDGNSSAANAADDGAIAVDKVALQPGEVATFDNYTTYDKGINGIMVDVAGIPDGHTIRASDFVFRTGADDTSWSAGPAPASVTVRPGAGERGSDRVTVAFADGAIKNKWLEVTILADANTGLGAPDVFYFGNLVGETGDNVRSASVNAIDMGRLRANMLTAASVDNEYDLNRDGRINAVDLGVTRAAQLRTLPMITAPDGTSAAAPASEQVAPVLTLLPTGRRAHLWDELQADVLPV